MLKQEGPISQLAGLAIDQNKRPAQKRKRSRVLGIITMIVIIAAVGGGLWYYQTTGKKIVQAMSKQPTDVELVTITLEHSATQPRIVLVANGKIVSDVQVKVATKVSGQIVELLVEQGDVVEKDQVLARIEDDTYRAQRDEAQAAVERRKSELTRLDYTIAQADAQIEEKRALAEFEKRNHERLIRLRAEGKADDLELNNARNRAEAAGAVLESARAAAQSARAARQVTAADLAAAEAQLRLLQKRLDDCNITAPIGGVILERNAQVGDFLAAEGGRGANANAQLVEIADMSLMRVEIDVSERDIHRLKPDMQARVTPDIEPDHSYAARILWIDPIGDYARATVQVKVRILDPGPGLKVGGSAKVEFLAGPSPTEDREHLSYWLPKDAVQTTPGIQQAVVFTVNNGRAIAHLVQIGTRTDEMIEVLSGLRNGMQIIAGNVQELQNNDPVTVTNQH